MKQQGLVMVFALLVLLSLTILGISAVSSSLTQSKMAMSTQQAGLAFDAAEAAIAGVFFESEDEVLLSDVNLTDPLSEARQGNVYDPQVNTLSCFDENTWTNRQMPSGALEIGKQNIGSENYQSTQRPKAGHVRHLYVNKPVGAQAMSLAAVMSIVMYLSFVVVGR